MIQFDLIQGLERFKKYAPHILCVILFLLLLNNCNNNEALLAEKKVLEKEIKQTKQLVEKTLIENKKIDVIIKKYKDTINFLDTQNIKKQKKILELSNENNRLKSSIKKYSTDQLLQYYIDRYKQPNNVFKTNLGITFKDTLSKAIAIDLTDYDFVSKELVIKNDIISNKNNIISSKDTIINNLEIQKKNTTFVLEKQGLIIDNQEDLIKNQEKIIKRATRKQKILKVAIPIAIISGIATGVLISK